MTALPKTPTAPAGPPAPETGVPVYRNPVLNADWSDPDVIAVGDDYYLTASSFGRAPGLPILHSRDLVNWRIIGHALERLEPEQAFTSPRHDRGVWAPSIRHHAGRFWIFWGDPDHGIYQVNAEDVRGPWSRPHLLKAGRGLIDPCPLWDDDGRAWLVHAWAKSRSGIKNRLTGHRMSPDGRELLDTGRTVVDGDALPGWFTLEGPKLYKHAGWYWIFAPAGGVETGWQGAFRSRNVLGPYEGRVVLEQGDTDVNGPHQGAWVRAADGSDWFLHFQHRGPYGRVVHLQPMRWTDEGEGEEAGWPVIGNDGEPVAAHTGPVPVEQTTVPARDDDFPGGRFGRQWSWTANPPLASDRGNHGEGWTVAHSGDGLWLVCRRTADAHDLRALPNVLVQRLPGDPCVVEVELRLDSDEPGAKAGLAVLGDAFSWIGLERDDSGIRLVHRFAESVAEHERDAAHPRPAPNGRARLRVAILPGARCRFSARMGEDTDFLPSGPPFAATPWRWVGAQLGLFATAPQGGGPAGTAAFTGFRVT